MQVPFNVARRLSTILYYHTPMLQLIRATHSLHHTIIMLHCIIIVPISQLQLAPIGAMMGVVLQWDRCVTLSGALAEQRGFLGHDKLL